MVGNGELDFQQRSFTRTFAKPVSNHRVAAERGHHLPVIDVT